MKFVLKNPTLYLATLAIGLVVLGVFSNTASAVASPAGAITLTFDDGNPSQYEIVAPILKAGGQPATFYINSGWLGVDEWYMTWDQVTDLHKNGFEIAGHTLNHIELPTVNNATKTTEINQDYQNFVAHGITPTNFAVPFGAYDNITTALVASRYNSLRAFINLVENPCFESGLTGWSTDNLTNVEVNMNSKGNYPNPKNSIKMIGSGKPAHLFGGKIPVTFGGAYGF